MDIIDFESLASIERDHDNLLPTPVAPKKRRVAQRKRRELTLADKVEFIKYCESLAGSLSITAAANKFCIGKTAALGIIKRKEEHLKQYSMNAGSNIRRAHRHSKFQEINSCMWKWFTVARLKQLSVSGPCLQEKARRFAARLGVSNFKASNGWLESFKHCYNIQKLTSRQPANMYLSTNSNFDWTSKLPRLTGDYGLEDIFACKAITLYFRGLPLESALQRLDDEVTRRDECLTILLCCSALGEKVVPWIVGGPFSSAHPSATDRIRRRELVLRTSPDGSLGRDVFASFLEGLNLRLQRQSRKAVLFLDQMFVDVPELSEIATHFFPINIVERSNPMDLGIESFVKAYYRNRFLRSLADDENVFPGAATFWPHTGVDQACAWICEAWEALEPDLVVSTFGDAGFNIRRHVPPPRATQALCQELQATIKRLYASDPQDCAAAEDYVVFDRLTVNDALSEGDWEEQIVAEILVDRAADSTSGTAVASPEELLSLVLTDEDSGDGDNGTDVEIGKTSPGSELTHKEAAELVCKLKNFAVAKEDCLLPLVDSLQNAIMALILDKEKTKKKVSNEIFVHT